MAIDEKNVYKEAKWKKHVSGDLECLGQFVGLGASKE